MWIDALLVMVVIVVMILGYRKGFLLSVVQLAGWIVSFVAAVLLWEPVKNFLMEHLNIAGKFTEVIENKLIGSGSTTGEAAESTFRLPQGLAELLDSVRESTSSALASSFAQVLAEFCLAVIAFVIVVVLIKIAMSILTALFRGTNNIPILGHFNRLMGALLGLIQGLVIVMVLLLFMVPFLNVSENDFLGKAYDQAALTPYLYENNPIVFVLGGM